ncbi:MAG: S8 family serine peptidase [Pseudomonadota bacterium]
MLELLRAAATLGQPTGAQAFPDDVLGFLLHYPTVPDVAAERVRIADLLGEGGFDLFAYSEEIPDILVLNFPGILIEQSPEYLFEESESLREALGLTAVTPEIPQAFADGEAAGADAESLDGIVSAACKSKAASPGDPRWAIKMLKVDRAWAAHAVSGRGVRIGQPDSGVADHREIADGLLIHLGHNYLDGVADPTDPLRASMAAAGHGTRTSSQVISRADFDIVGSAPGAELVPIRAVNSVVIGAGRAVARAVDHARQTDCHVISMSLGGPIAGRALRQAIARAVRADLIVIAAAGNCVRVVTYPAWDQNVIAVAAVDIHKNRWRGSCRGSQVDVSAPGENVHVASRLPGDGGDVAAKRAIEPRGQGTSYAAALTAGVAALWLEKFSRADVAVEARRRGIAVQELFRAALRATTETPAGWDGGQMGTGIVDADRLLGMGLADIPGPIPTEGAPLLSGMAVTDFPPAMQAEASFIATDWALRDVAAPGLLESALPARPSPALAAILTRTAPEAFPAPVIISEPSAIPASMENAFRRLATGQSTGLESAETLDEGGALARLKSEGSQAILDQAQAALSRRANARPALVDPGVQAEALARIAPVVDQLMQDDAADRLGDQQTRVVLEALVRLTGRPALRVTGDELDDPLIGDWASTLRPIRNRWRRHVRAVGRIDVEVVPGKWVHAGTGYRIADNRVITNRHVLDSFVDQLPSAPGTQRFRARRPASIVFDPDAKDDATRFALGDVVTAGARRVGRFINLSKLDLAIFEMASDNGNGSPPPAVPVDQMEGLDDPDLSKLLVAGYPAEPVRPGETDDDDAFWARIGEIYGDVYGVKYISPGFVMTRPGQVATDLQGWTFTHDATTMRGNSGSVIVALHGGVRLVGLHVGGESRTQNYAHDLTRVKAAPDDAFDANVLPAIL